MKPIDKKQANEKEPDPVRFIIRGEDADIYGCLDATGYYETTGTWDDKRQTPRPVYAVRMVH